VWKGSWFRTQQNAPPWLAKSFVGKLGGAVDFEKLEEEIVKGGMLMVKVRNLGDDLALVSPAEGVVMEDIVKSNAGWFNNIFSSIKPWSEGREANHRVVWVRCYGVPLQCWSEDCFTKVIGELYKTASLVLVDALTLSWDVVEYARMKVRLGNDGSANMTRKVMINKLLCNILMEEEFAGVDGGGHCAYQWCDGSSDSVSSSETYVEESFFSGKSGLEKARVLDGEEG